MSALENLMPGAEAQGAAALKVKGSNALVVKPSKKKRKREEGGSWIEHKLYGRILKSELQNYVAEDKRIKLKACSYKDGPHKINRNKQYDEKDENQMKELVTKAMEQLTTLMELPTINKRRRKWMYTKMAMELRHVKAGVLPPIAYTMIRDRWGRNSDDPAYTTPLVGELAVVL